MKEHFTKSEAIAYLEGHMMHRMNLGDTAYAQHYLRLINAVEAGRAITDVQFDDTSAEAACTSAACIARAEQDELRLNK